jgi:hypothetical protein
VVALVGQEEEVEVLVKDVVLDVEGLVIVVLMLIMS